MAQKCLSHRHFAFAPPDETASETVKVKLMSVPFEISWAKFGLVMKQKICIR